MTIDEAIKHCEQVVKEKESEAQNLEYSKLDWKYEANQCSECAEEHRQLAEWLKELKAYMEQDSNAISKLGMQHILNHEVKWINERMTSEEAIKSLKSLVEIRRKYCYMQTIRDEIDALDMAIQALSRSEIPNTCGDAISRQAVLNTLDNMDKALDEDRTVENYKELLKECYAILTPVTPQQRTGRWEWVQYDENPEIGNFHCSECRYIPASFNMSAQKLNYCPKCGAKMEVEADD